MFKKLVLSIIISLVFFNCQSMEKVKELSKENRITSKEKITTILTIIKGINASLCHDSFVEANNNPQFAHALKELMLQHWTLNGSKSTLLPLLEKLVKDATIEAEKRKHTPEMQPMNFRFCIVVTFNGYIDTLRRLTEPTLNNICSNILAFTKQEVTILLKLLNDIDNSLQLALYPSASYQSMPVEEFKKELDQVDKKISEIIGEIIEITTITAEEVLKNQHFEEDKQYKYYFLIELHIKLHDLIIWIDESNIGGYKEIIK